jgi:hypothetical protein
MRNYALHKGPCNFLNSRISPWEISFLFLLCFSSLSVLPLSLSGASSWDFLPCLPSSSPLGDSTGARVDPGSAGRRPGALQPRAMAARSCGSRRAGGSASAAQRASARGSSGRSRRWASGWWRCSGARHCHARVRRCGAGGATQRRRARGAGAGHGGGSARARRA